MGALTIILCCLLATYLTGGAVCLYGGGWRAWRIALAWPIALAALAAVWRHD